MGKGCWEKQQLFSNISVLEEIPILLLWIKSVLGVGEGHHHTPWKAFLQQLGRFYTLHLQVETIFTLSGTGRPEAAYTR